MRCLTLAPWLPFILLAPGAASACSCFPITPEQHILSTDVIFSGRVIAVEGGPPDYVTCAQTAEGCSDHGVAQIAVEQVYKGPTADYLSVQFGWDGAACGTPFQVNTERMVFAAVGREGQLGTHLCLSGPYWPHDPEYVRRFEAMRSERTRLATLVPSDEAVENYHRFHSLRSSVAFFEEVNDPYGRLEAFERWLSIVRFGNGVSQSLRDLFARHTFDAVVTALRIGQYERAVPFMREYQASGAEGPLAKLLQSYLDFSLGELSSIEETSDWVSTDGPQTGRLFTGSIRADGLQGTVLSQSVFRGTRLGRSDLSEARIEDTLVFDVDFQGVSFADAILQRVIIDGAEFQGVSFSGAHVADSQIRNATLLLAPFDNAVIANSVLQNVSFSQFMQPRVLHHPIELGGASFPQTEFIDVELSFTDLRGTDFSSATFEDVDLQFARYDCATRWPQGLEVDRLPLIPVESDCGDRVLIANFSNTRMNIVTDFSGLDLANARFAGTVFYNDMIRPVSFARSNLRKADFSLSTGSVVFEGADLTNADFTNADIGGFRFYGRELEGRPAILTGTRFQGAVIELEDFYDIDAPERSADLASANLEGAIFPCRFMGGPDEEAMTDIFRSVNPGARGAFLDGDCPR